jgi:hypothetical protein
MITDCFRPEIQEVRFGLCYMVQGMIVVYSRERGGGGFLDVADILSRGSSVLGLRALVIAVALPAFAEYLHLHESGHVSNQSFKALEASSVGEQVGKEGCTHGINHNGCPCIQVGC